LLRSSCSEFITFDNLQDYPLKLFVTLLFVLLVCACAAPRPAATSYLDRADAAITRQDWEVAYRLLEDGFLSSQSDLRDRAITMARQYPKVIAFGALTFSRESVSETIAAHGYERGIDLERRRLDMFRVVAAQTVYESAKSNVDFLAVAVDRERKEKQRVADERQHKDEQARAELERKKQEARLTLIDAAQKSRFLCKFKSECDKAFSLTQIFVSENSDMKIQVATDTIIESYNPTESLKTALKAIRIPQRGDAAEIVLTASCRDEGRVSLKETCDQKLLSIYLAYPVFVQSVLRP
jgi:hypothetical protein